jgi:hypothetical protein
MSQVITKESLNVLAALAFQAIAYENDENADFEDNLRLPGEPLYYLIASEHNLDYRNNKQHYAFGNGFVDGMLFGLAVAAAIVSNGADNNAVIETVRAELQSPIRCWPEDSQKAA